MLTATNYKLFSILALSALFHYLGPSIAYLLFSQVGTIGMALIRNLSSALVLVFFFLSTKKQIFIRNNGTYSPALYLGACLAIMNVSFYKAIDSLSLGTVAAMEFLAPVLLAASATRRFVNIVAIILSVVGVNFLFNGQFQTNFEGVAWASINAVFFGVYISLVHYISRCRKMPDFQLLMFAFVFSSMLIAPFSIPDFLNVEFSLWLVFLCFTVGIVSSLIPYVLDQLILQKLPRESISIYLSILPFVAALIGAVVLYQIPTLLEFTGLALIALAIYLHKPNYDSQYS